MDPGHLARAATPLTMDTDRFDETPPPAPALTQDAGFKFKGQNLAAYSFGRRILFQGFTGPNDDPPNGVFTLGLIFILLASEENCRRWLYDLKALRADLAAWIKDFPEPDYDEALKVAQEVLDHAKKGRVGIEVKPEGAAGKT